jgi:hypothetical protein
MASLQELLASSFGDSNTKTASAGAQDDDALTKLARDLNLDGFFGKEAEEDEDEKDDKDDDKEEKSAGLNLDGLYSSLFPDDQDITIKTAEEEKIAAEESLGARAYDHYAAQWDRRMEKVAADALSGSATISSGSGAHHDGPVQEDVEPPQAQANNKPSGSSAGVNTKSTSVQDEVSAHNSAATVGNFEQKHASALALQKYLLLAQLED